MQVLSIGVDVLGRSVSENIIQNQRIFARLKLETLEIQRVTDHGRITTVYGRFSNCFMELYLRRLIRAVAKICQEIVRNQLSTYPICHPLLPQTVVSISCHRIPQHFSSLDGNLSYSSNTFDTHVF